MAQHKADIALFGAGIAGLWALARLKKAGYDAVLLETDSIGGGQTIASQGIIHSGLKYALAGKINELARSISAMPERWREALKGQGPVNLSAAKISADSQMLLIPPGFMGGLIKLVAEKTLGGSVREIEHAAWFEEIKFSGFKGSVIHMNEPVLDIPSLIRSLTEPYKNCVRKINSVEEALSQIEAKAYVFTAAGSNEGIARKHHHQEGLETQARPLVMGLIKNAPFPLYAHLAAASEKPVMTITTHKMRDGMLVWYLGGSVAERPHNADPAEVYKAAQAAFQKYMPDLNLSAVEWSVLPIDRIEGQSLKQGKMPDMPVIHAADNCLYCWPTKLTFAPLLADRILAHLQTNHILPSGKESDWAFLPEAPYNETPWDKAIWSKQNL